MNNFDKWMAEVGAPNKQQETSKRNPRRILPTKPRPIRTLMSPIYVLHPGYIRAEDGDLHFISDRNLASLYEINESRCVTVVDGSLKSCCGVHLEDHNCIHLYPRGDGEYTKPE